MKRAFVANFLFSALIAASAAPLRAEVKTEEKTSVKFEGMMGRMMGLFGGKAAKEGIVTTIAVKGDRKISTSEYSGEIVDLGEQKVYLLDMKKKTYEAVTFQEMRQRMEEAQKKASEAAKEQSGKEQSGKEEPGEGKKMEIDFSLKESGQTRTINGYNCREVVMTVTAREKGKTIEDSGGMVMTSHVWLAPVIAAAKEIADFDMRYYKALGEPFGGGPSAEQMTMAMAMYPALKEMMGKVQAENVNMKGTAILTETSMEAVKSPESVSQERKEERESGAPTSLGRLGGMLGRKIVKKKEDTAAQPSNRATIMTTYHELLKVSSSVGADEVAVPAGFKAKK